MRHYLYPLPHTLRWFQFISPLLIKVSDCDRSRGLVDPLAHNSLWERFDSALSGCPVFGTIPVLKVLALPMLTALDSWS